MNFFIEDTNGVQLKGLVLADGDATISINGSPFVNLTNLPVTRRADSVIFDLDLTEDEDVVGAEIRIEDQGPPQWRPLSITIDESNVPTAEEIATETDARLLDAGDATDLITAIAARIGNTNVDEAVLVGLIRADLERTDGLLAGIPAAVDQELDPVTSQIIQDIADLVGAIRTDRERVGGISEQTLSVLNASTAAILNSITEETAGIDQAIADLNTGGGGTGPVELTSGSVESIRDGLATSEQADAIKQDTERAFKDGDTIQVDVVARSTDSEESLTAIHTRVGTQEPQVGN